VGPSALVTLPGDAKECGTTALPIRQRRSRVRRGQRDLRMIEAWYDATRRHSAFGYLSPIDYMALHIGAETAT
jgi:hypothetical protein